VFLIENKMKFICKVKFVIMCVGLSVGVALTNQAQAKDIDLLCYVIMPDQRIVDLRTMCGRTIQKTRVLSPAERQAQFLRNFYEKIQSHPAGKEILEQSDPDALIGKANQVCNAIKQGTYQPQTQPNPDAPKERRIPDLEEAFVDQIASQGFCVDSK
jgi:hypothetical protein